MSIEIIPAILPEDFDDLREHLSLVRGVASMVQIDITDGRFTPDATWPYENDAGGLFYRMAQEEEEMPFWQEVAFEIDLMVQEAEKVAIDWIRIGARRIIVHLESDSDIEKIIRDTREITSDRESPAYTEIGVAINTTTSVEEAINWIPENEDEVGADFIQCMGIERIGYQGQEFDNRVIDKIVDIRSRRSGVIISVDGGVSTETAGELVEAGANRLVSGSAVFESEDVGQAVEMLRSAINDE